MTRRRETDSPAQSMGPVADQSSHQPAAPAIKAEALHRKPSQEKNDVKPSAEELGSAFLDADGNEYLQDLSPEEDASLLVLLCLLFEMITQMPIATLKSFSGLQFLIIRV